MLRPDLARAARALASLPAVLSLFSLCACSSSGSSSSPPSDAGMEATRPDDTTAQADRTACKFARGALPAQTLGSSIPIGSQMPIDNIVVVMMENHSFDSYLGHLNAYGHRTGTNVAESAPDTASNPDTAADGGTVPWAHAPHLCSVDTDHGWGGTHVEIDNGKMDGFAQRNEGSAVPAGADPSLGSGARSLWWYDETDLPLYYDLANKFAIADHYHCSVPGPTWPNRRFLFAATSFGGTVTNLPAVLEKESDYPYPAKPASVLDELEKSGTKWMYYSDGILPSIALIYSDYATRWHRNPVGTMADFTAAAAAGKLPAVSFVDPALAITSSGTEDDEHPPGDVQVGEQFVGQVVQAVTTSPQWAHTALFLTHDEHGGFYDHVAPPPACPPDDIKPVITSAGDTIDAGFDMAGVRVVLIAVSPYSKPGYVGHHFYDHTSITRFIEARYDLPALTARDANAEPLTDLFDFSSAPAFLTAPSIAAAPLDQPKYDYCATTFGDGG
jgi:phospholipase C